VEPSTISLYFTILAICVLILGVSSDALALVLAVIGTGIAIILQMRSQSGQFTKTNRRMKKMGRFQRRMTLSLIDEKTAVIQSYILDAPNWRSIQDGVSRMTDRTVADGMSIVRIKKYATDEQTVVLNEALTRLSQVMQTNNYDIGRINALIQHLNAD
jgi:uncharacterized membrane protein